jgi:hypothetical protein
MTDGILNVRIPKKAAVQPKRIEVKPGVSTPVKPGKPS